MTKYPEEDVIVLKTDSPLILSYMVCGSNAVLSRYVLEVTVSHSGVGGITIMPKENIPLVRDSDTEIHGISVSKWDATSPHHELCYEIPVRVWPDNPKVMDLSIELKLSTRIGRFPLKYTVGLYRFSRPTQAPTTATVPETSTESEATSAFRLPFASDISTIQLPRGEGSTVHSFRLLSDENEGGNSLNCRCYCEQDVPSS